MKKIIIISIFLFSPSLAFAVAPANNTDLLNAIYQLQTSVDQFNNDVTTTISDTGFTPDNILFFFGAFLAFVFIMGMRTSLHD